MANARPATNAAYLTASALHNAGFKGWPLVVMTALAGRESRWNPTALNNNPSTGDYSVGLFQINYMGDLLPARTQEYGSPQALLSDPQLQANAAYKMAGGNNLTNLQPWALTPSPKQGVMPVGSTASIGQNTLAPETAQAMAAAVEVGTFGPAPASQIAQPSAWPGASVTGSPVPGSDTLGGGGANAAGGAAPGPDTSGGCNHPAGPNAAEPTQMFTIPHTSAGLTYCNVKAFLGAMSLTAGGFLVVVGMITLIGGGFAGKVIAMVPPVGRASRTVSSSAPSTSAPATESARAKEDRVWNEMQAEQA